MATAICRTVKSLLLVKALLLKAGAVRVVRLVAAPVRPTTRSGSAGLDLRQAWQLTVLWPESLRRCGLAARLVHVLCGTDGNLDDGFVQVKAHACGLKMNAARLATGQFDEVSEPLNS